MCVLHIKTSIGLSKVFQLVCVFCVVGRGLTEKVKSEFNPYQFYLIFMALSLVHENRPSIWKFIQIDLEC